MARGRSSLGESQEKSKETKENKNDLKAANKASSSNAGCDKKVDQARRGRVSPRSDSRDSSSSGFRSRSSAWCGLLSASSSNSYRKTRLRSQYHIPSPKRPGRSPISQTKRQERSRSTPLEERDRARSRTSCPPPKPRERSLSRSSLPKRRERTRNPFRKCSSQSPAAKQRVRSVTQKTFRIHIKQLTQNVTKEHVAEIFSNFGEVKNVQLPTEGIAFVEFATHVECEVAIKKMDGGQIDGQEITVSAVFTTKVRGSPQRRMSPVHRRRNKRWRNRFNRNNRRLHRRVGRRSSGRRSRSQIRRRSECSDSYR